ncbi:MAG: DUF4304 domain-containing protein [Bacteroidetes bacterium]|jgi:hypothetical protein|nr:DUF4304 domain-containing protein [Bacteroidota bacterium]
MTGAQKREKMDVAIKQIVIPFIREQGFKGSYPHFRREKAGKLNLLAFQFSLYSPSFVVEISNCARSGITLLDGKHFEPEKCRVHYTGNRMRIGSTDDPKSYSYDFAQELVSENVYETLAKKVVSNWHTAEKWWSEN